MSKYIELTNAFLYSFLLKIDINHKACVDTFFPLSTLYICLCLFKKKFIKFADYQNQISFLVIIDYQYQYFALTYISISGKYLDRFLRVNNPAIGLINPIIRMKFY